jgi:mannose PTS system EIIA component
MYSFIFITHGDLGKTILDVASRIMDEDLSSRCSIFTIEFSMVSELEEIKESIKKAADDFIAEGNSVIIFVDLFGGSPSNIAFTIAKNEKMDVLSGFNLPMVMYAIEHMNSSKELAVMVDGILRSGIQNITSAKKLLETREKK